VGVADADVETVRRTDVACAQDPHAHQVVCRFRSSSDEVGLGIVEPRYPVRSAEPREVRVTVDEARDDGRSGRIDDLGAARIGGAAIGTEVRDAAVAHENGDTAAERRRTTVGKCRAAKEGRRWRYLVFLPMVRMKVSMGMAESVSIWTVPRAPRPTETREMVSLSFASTMLTKS